MALTVERWRPGPQSRDRLFASVNALKGGELLAPVSVVVPGNHIGLWLRRSLATQGYANVRFGVLGRIAEPLGAPALAAAGRNPLTVPAQEAAILEAVRRHGQAFGEAGSHPSLISTLRDLFGELRRGEWAGEPLDGLSDRGLMAEGAVAVYREYREIVAGSALYDDNDLLEAASAALAGSAPAQLGEMGPLVAYLPQRLQAAEVRFLQALAAHTQVLVALPWLGDPEADRGAREIGQALGAPDPESAQSAPPALIALVAAPDAAEEVRHAVRSLLAEIEGGVSLRQAAILYRDQEPYGALVRDTLDHAGVPWAGLDGRSLAASWAGRGLLGLLRLRDRDFARADVLAWLGALPLADPGRVSIGEWDRQSRQAGVVRGAQQWQDRLRRVARETAATADESEKAGDRSEGSIRYLRREAGALNRMANHIENVERVSRIPGDLSWPELTGWAERVRRDLIPSDDSWPEREREADEMVGELLTQMAAAAAVPGEVTPERFLEALQGAIEARRQAEGKLGSGVAVGPISAVAGMSFERVFIVGATERSLPRPPSPDPVFPPDGGPDPLGRPERQRAGERRDFLAALAAAEGGSIQVSFPAWDEDLRPSYPSPWVIEYAQPVGEALSAADAREGRGASNLAGLASPEGALQGAPALLNLAEWRIARARETGGDLAASALAARPDLPLARHLEVRAARLSDSFTEFDGNIAGAAGIRQTADGLAGSASSPSGIEAWATCPYRFFLNRVVRVEETERPEQDVAWAITSATKGTLVHAILNCFLEELRQAGRPAPREAYTEADHSRLLEIAHEEFGHLERAGATGHLLAWENERRSILADLDSFLREDAAMRGDGLVPVFFEQGFGMPGESWPELDLELEGGRRARLRGRIDRIDLGPDSERPQAARLIDYKTGSNRMGKSQKDPVHAGTKVQPAVYAEAIWARYPGIAVTSGYWFISAKGKFEYVAIADGRERLREVLDVVDRGMRSGAYPQVPGGDTTRPGRTGWDNCIYCPYDRICPTGRDQLRERKQADPGPRIHLELARDAGDPEDSDDS